MKDIVGNSGWCLPLHLANLQKAKVGKGIHTEGIHIGGYLKIPQVSILKGEGTEFQTNTMTGEIQGVVTTTGGKAEYYYTDTETTETAARTWLNGKAGIT